MIMDALIVYGSLINKTELVEQEFPLDNTSSVVVRGFKRMFCQEPSWRTSGQGEERAVLNVLSSDEHWFNGVLISGLPRDLFTDLDKRERGYVRVKVELSCLRKYDYSSPTTATQNIYIYAGKTDKQSDSILPNMSYLRICLEGAKQWGEDFYNDFLDSTFAKNTVTLRDYLDKAV